MSDEIIKILDVIEITTTEVEVVEIVDTTPKVDLWMTAPGPEGPPGPQGPRGNDGASSPTYMHEQLVADTTWIVNHNLNKFPSVSITDSAKTVVMGEIEYVTINELKVHFSAPFSGHVYCN